MAALPGKPARHRLAAQAEARPVLKAQSFMQAALALQTAVMAMAAVVARLGLSALAGWAAIATQVAAVAAALMVAAWAAMVMAPSRGLVLAALALMVADRAARAVGRQPVIPACPVRNIRQALAEPRVLVAVAALPLVPKILGHHRAALAGFMAVAALAQVPGPARMSGAMAARASSLLPMPHPGR
jgi:hypothetical protein